ncbi:hypothetical protein [uncultured Parabacteroides sp.]|uniref:hypothetical protein n=1 Tax=uncultured Parabacteroides sp. TaxID=512312 RepID=UPI0025FEF434|nr:hypothetical protein [uncultured Parabacteroides sp.]
MEYGKKIQIHNFVMLKHKVDKMSFIKVSSVAGDWLVSYREDNIMYLTLDMAKEEDYEALHNVFTAIYGTCNIVDSDFTKDVFDALYRTIKRRKDTAPLQMDDGRVLEEDRRMHEIKEEIEKGE